MHHATLTIQPTLSTWPAARREEAMRALEAGTLRHLDFDAIVFRAGPNRNHLRIREQDLADFAASFEGVPFLRDHRIDSVDARAGIVLRSQMHHGVGNAAIGRMAARYMRQTIRLTTRRDIRAFLEGQIDRFSIAWYYDSVACSICGKEWGECAHKPGRAYHLAGKDAPQSKRLRCELVFANPRGKEVSAVNAPAVEGTGLLTAMPHIPLPPSPQVRSHRPSLAPPPPITRVLPVDLLSNKETEMHEPQTQRDALLAGDALLSEDGAFAANLALLDDPTPHNPVPHHTAPHHAAHDGGMRGADQWLAALRGQVIDGMLARSGLSAAGMTAVRASLNAGDASDALSPQRVQQVIEAQRSAENTLRGSARGVVQGIQPTFGGGISGMRTAEDEVQAAMNWLLGDTRAATPAPHLRNLRDIYLAVTGDVNFWGVFNPDYARLQSANSGTLAGMAVNALNKAVMFHYDNMATYRWYEPIVHVIPHDGTTQPLQLIHMDGIAALPAVGEGAAYTEATTGDSKETATFGKYGAYVGITLEMIRRSEIARIQAIPRLLVQAAIRRRSATVAAVFTGNPVLADDSTALFHADHGNTDTAALSAAAWEAARTRIFEQTLPGTGKPLALWPTYCLTPIELYDDALTLFGYGSGDVGKPNAAGTAQEPNVYGHSRPGDPRPIPIVVPEWSDANDWAYIVDPRLHPVLVMAYANAAAGGAHALPEIFEVRSESAGLMFSNDVLPVKLRDWWAFGVGTYVGIGRNAVA